MDRLFGLNKSYPPMENVTLLTTTYDPISLAIVESKLRDAEIPYITKERGSGGALKVVAGYSVEGTDVFVKKEDLEVATALIEIHEEDCEDTNETESDSNNDN